MHGIHATRSNMLRRADLLHRNHFAVLLCDFQSHGESTGNHITFGYLESRDAQAQIAFLRQRAPGERIGVIGVSLGGAAALLATRPLDVDALVLESVYPAIQPAISNRLAARFGRWASIFTPLLTVQFRPRLGFSPSELRPIDRVGSIRIPKLFLAGAADRYTPIRESEQLFAAAAQPKELVEFEGAGHVDLYGFAPRQYEEAVVHFLANALTSVPSAGVTPALHSLP
jgi:pimeloyl-ACP methyl ester carboxylesterase